MSQELKSYVNEHKEGFFLYLQRKGIYYAHQQALFLEHLEHPSLEKMLLNEFAEAFYLYEQESLVVILTLEGSSNDTNIYCPGMKP